MSAGTRAPLPLMVLGISGIALALVADSPLVLAAVAAGAMALVLAAPARPPRLLIVGSLVSAVALVVITPIVAGQGDLILFRVPDLPILDDEVTAQELAAGVAAGLRLVAVTLLVAAVPAHVDPDRLLGGAMRLAPRSAMVCALAARLLPTLQRDARAVGEAARLRGVDLTTGRRLARARRAAPLALPLVGAALGRGLDVAEAMAARGYGSGPRTRRREAPLAARELAVLALGLALAAAAAVAVVTGSAAFRFYPTLSGAPGVGAIAAAAVAAGALGGAAGLLWSDRALAGPGRHATVAGAARRAV